MSIREQAWQAFTLVQQDAIEQHRQGLLTVLEGLTVPLDLAGVQSSSTGRLLVVFTDGDVHLGVQDRDGWLVYVVVADVHGWSEVSPPVGSLAALSPHVPPNVPSDPDVWVEGNMYSEGAVVSHDGQVWRSTVDNNSWEPGVVHSVWVIA